MPEVSFTHNTECWILASPNFFFFLHFNCSIAILNKSPIRIFTLSCTLHVLYPFFSTTEMVMILQQNCTVITTAVVLKHLCLAPSFE